MIRKNAKTHIFRLETENSLYALRAVRGERVEHLYYGKRVRSIPIAPYPHNYGFSPNDAEKSDKLSHDIIPAELPGYGAGDFRAEAIRVTDKTGASATDFRFLSARIYRGKPLSMVSAVMLAPVRPGTLYRMMGLVVDSATAL